MSNAHLLHAHVCRAIDEEACFYCVKSEYLIWRRWFILDWQRCPLPLIVSEWKRIMRPYVIDIIDIVITVTISKIWETFFGGGHTLVVLGSSKPSRVLFALPQCLQSSIYWNDPISVDKTYDRSPDEKSKAPKLSPKAWTFLQVVTVAVQRESETFDEYKLLMKT